MSVCGAGREAWGGTWRGQRGEEQLSLGCWAYEICVLPGGSVPLVDGAKATGRSLGWREDNVVETGGARGQVRKEGRAKEGATESTDLRSKQRGTPKEIEKGKEHSERRGRPGEWGPGHKREVVAKLNSDITEVGMQNVSLEHDK